MSPEDATLKLYSLTPRQVEVLQLFCSGFGYKEIAGRLVISENTVKSHMANIYIKLGLDMLPDAQRKKALHQEFCAALQEIEFPLEKPEEPKELAPVPEYVWKMVEDDEKAIIRKPPNKIIKISSPPSQEPKPARRLRWLLAGMVLGSIVIACGVIAVLRINNWLIAQPAIGESPTAIAMTEVVFEESQPQQQLTYTSLPTYTPYPTFTSLAISASQEPNIVTPSPKSGEQTPPPGSVIPAGQSFSKDGITIVTGEYVQKEYDLIRFEFTVYNDRSNPFTLRFRTKDLHLKDNLGNEYPLRTRGGLQVYEYTFENEHVVAFAYYSSMWFDWTVPIEATQLIFTIDEIAGMTDLNWVFDLR